MKTDQYRLERISEMGHLLLDVISEEGITHESLARDFKLQWLVSTPLFNIGEQVNCLSSDFVAQHSDQPWSSIAGLRHRLVHNYEGTNWSLIGHILEHDIEPFVNAVDVILEELKRGPDSLNRTE